MVLKAVKRKSKQSKQNRKPSKKQRVAIVVALFNGTVCQNMLKGALKTLKANGYSSSQIQVFEVSGAFEIPLVAKKVAESKKYAGIIAIGCVIKGDTPHFDYVCKAVTEGCLRVQLDTGCPIAFGVITVNTDAQAKERSSQNKYNKGSEAASALLDTILILEKI